jgi:Tripartite tricarboxylate transporter TctB family
LKFARMEIFVDVAWLVFAGAYCWVASTYPPGGRFVPLTIGLAALVMGAVHFAGNLLAFVRPFTHGEKEAEDLHAQSDFSELKAVGWAVALLAGIYIIGALPAVFLFFLVYFGLRGNRWLLGLASAVLMTVVTWGLFGQLMELELPQGLITEFFLRSL